MGNEMFQARLDDSFAAEVHEYREANHMSKSEVVRHALRELVEDDDGRRTETMNQAGATQIVSLAIAVGVITYVSTHLPPVAPAGLVALLIVGVTLIAYGFGVL